MSTNLALSYKINFDTAAALKDVQALLALLNQVSAVKPAAGLTEAVQVEVKAAQDAAAQKAVIAMDSAKAAIEAARFASAEIMKIEADTAKDIARQKAVIAVTTAQMAAIDARKYAQEAANMGGVPQASPRSGTTLNPASSATVGINLVDQALTNLAKNVGAKAFGMDFDRGAASADKAAAAAVRAGIAAATAASAASTAAAPPTNLSLWQRLAGYFSGASTSAKDLATSTTSAQSSMGDLFGLIAAGTALKMFEHQIKAITDTMTDFQQTMSRLKFADDGDMRKAATDYQFIIETADRLGIKTKDVAAGYSKFAVAGKEVGLGNEEIKKTFLGVAEAAKSFGLNSQQTGSAFLAITQMASKQKVQMQELSLQMGEKLPVAMSAAAKATGLSTAAFQKALSTGTLDVKTFFPAFAYQLRTMAEKELPAATSSFESESNRLSNSIQRMRTEAGQGDMGKALTAGLKSMTTALEDPRINLAFQSLMVGFGKLAESAGEHLPSVVDSFMDMVSRMAVALLKFGVTSEDFFHKLALKATMKLGGSVFTSWLVPAGAADRAATELAAIEGKADAQIAAINEKFDAKNAARDKARKFSDDKKAAEMLAKYAKTQDEADKIMAPFQKKSLTPPIGDKPDNATFSPNKADHAAEQWRAAMRAFENDQLEATKKRAEADKQVEEAALTGKLKSFLISEEKYLADKAALDQKALDLEIVAAVSKQAELVRQFAEEKDPAKRKKIEGDLLKAKAEIYALEQKKVVIDVNFNVQIDDLKRKVSDLVIDIKANITDLQGNSLSAGLAKLKTETERMIERDPVVSSDAGKAAGLPDLVRSQAALKASQLEAAEYKKISDDKKAYLTLAEDEIARKIEAGQLTTMEGERAVRAERLKTADAILKQVEALEKLAKANPQNREMALSAAQARAEYEKLHQTLDVTATAINRDMAGSLANVVNDLVAGKNAIESLGSALSNVFGNLAKRILKEFEDSLFNAIQGKDGQGLGGILSKLIGDKGGGGGISMGGIVSGIGSLLGFADGGYTGPGGKHQPAGLVHAGEYVFTQAEVSSMGLPFFMGLKDSIQAGPRVGYAEGGLVGGGMAGLAARAVGPSINNAINLTPHLWLNLDDLASHLGRHPQIGRDVIKIVASNPGKLGR